DAEDPRNFAFHVVRNPDRRSLGDGGVRHGGTLELSRTDALARDVERVVAPSVQEPVAVCIDRRPVAVRPHAGEATPVRPEVPLVVAPDAARHPRPPSPAADLAPLA